MSPKIVDKAVRKQQILMAAATVFARFGYQRTKIEQIAEASGFAKGTIYLYFKSKEDLFYALFESFTQQFLDLDFLESDQSPLSKIEELLLQVMKAIDENSHLIPLTMEFWSVCGLEETQSRFSPHYANMLNQYHELVAQLFNEAKAQGEIHADVPVDSVTSSLLAIIDGLVIQQLILPDTQSTSVLKDTLPFFLGRLKEAP